MQGNLWILFDVRDLMCFCLTKDQKEFIMPNKPDRPGLGCQIGIDSGQPDHILILEMNFDSLTKRGGKIDHQDVPVFIRSATSSATSFTWTESPSALEASLSIVIQ